jgi:GPI transamidase subunit PIG-U
MQAGCIVSGFRPNRSPSRSRAFPAAVAPQSFQRSWLRLRDPLIVLVFALGLRVVFGLVTANTYDYDEFVILLLGREFAHGAVPYRDFIFFHPPGVLVLFRLLEPVTSWWWPLGRLLMMLVDSITAVLVWYVARLMYMKPETNTASGTDAAQLVSEHVSPLRSFNSSSEAVRKVALAAGLLYAANPLALISSVRVSQDALITMFGVAGIAFLLARPSHKAALAAGICLALAIWIKYPAVIFLPVYLVLAPRRIATILLATAGGLALLFLPFLPQLHQIYEQTVTFQQSRWRMALDQRLETSALYWLLVNVLAIFSLARYRPPLWLSVGFGLGLLFVLGAQVYYHYFVPIIPFGALLAGRLVGTLGRAQVRFLALTLVAILLGFGVAIARGGSSPLYVTAAHLSDVQPTVNLLQRDTPGKDRILADQFEYAYLAKRPAFDHYFWNVGVLVDAQYLEQRLPKRGAVVLSYGASSGFPAGFTAFMNSRYRGLKTGESTVWLIRG